MTTKRNVYDANRHIKHDVNGNLALAAEVGWRHTLILAVTTFMFRGGYGD